MQHLNIAEQRDGKDPGWRGDIKWGLKNTWTSAKWMCYTILAPEFLVSLSADSLINAYQSLESLKPFAEEDNVPWTLTHSFFANMGGFVIRSYTPERGKNRGLSFQTRELKDSTHIAERIQQNTMARPRDSHFEEPQGRGIIYLETNEIIALRESNTIKLPFLAKEEIMDKSKSDGFARTMAISQMLCMITQMIVRASRHLEISQLEIGTVAFASCAIIIYILNWSKPKSVGVPLTLLSYPGPFPGEVMQALGPPQSNQTALSFSWQFYGFPEAFNSRVRESPLLNHHSYRSGDHVSFYGVFYLIFISGLFGGIHFAGLNSTFPSDMERTMWRVASAVCTGIIVIYISAIVIAVLCWAFLKCVMSWIVDLDFVPYFIPKAINYFTLGLYIIAHLFLIMELFRCLFFLPPSAFVATWVSSIPHVS